MIEQNHNKVLEEKKMKTEFLKNESIVLIEFKEEAPFLGSKKRKKSMELWKTRF